MAITVSSTTELYSALSACKGGETILLEGGQYGSLNINPFMKPPVNMDFPSTVTIASADPANPAVFSKADVRNASNLTFDGITFDYTFKPGDKLGTTPFIFSYTDGLTIKNSTFDGDEAYGVSASSDGYGYGVGLLLRGSNNTVIEGNELYNFYKGINFSSNADTIVRGNELHSMRMDGMCFAKMDGVLIEDNYVHDFRGSPTSADHSDMIQFLTAATSEPSRNVEIRGNVLDIGKGTWTQSIFMNNEVVNANPASFAKMAYRNVTIEDNTITNAHQWGIYVSQVDGLAVNQNTVVHADGSKVDGGDHPVEIPQIHVTGSQSKNVTVTQNVTSKVTGYTGQANWTVQDNAFVQDQDLYASGYYKHVFVKSSLQPGADGSHQFTALAGSVIDLLDAGSDATQPRTAGLQVLFHVDDSDVATRIFDAGLSRLDGAALPAGTVYTWTFGDGTTGTGQKVSHTYTGGGEYETTLTVTLASGTKAAQGLAVPVDSPEVVTMDPSGHFTAYEQGEPIALGMGKTATADGLQLGASGISATVSRAHVSDVVGTNEMAIAFTLDADKVGSSGELFRLHGSFAVGVTKTGELQVQIMRDGTSTVWLTTKGAGLNSTLNQEHDVVVSLEGGQLQAWVDGELSGQATVPGVVGGTKGFGTHSLVFGNPWGFSNFSGDLSAFELSVGAGDYPASPVTAVLSSVAAATSSLALGSDAAAPAVVSDDLDTLQGGEDAGTGLLVDDASDRYATMLQEPLDAYAA